MKKIFSLALVLFAMIFAANAQYLLNEGFEDPNMNLPTGWTIIDNDGDGNNWYVLNNSQSSSGGYNIHSGEGHITSASYNSVALTPDNWLITPQINLTSNSTLTFWVAGQDPSYAAEYFSVYVATSPTVAAFTATTAVVSGTATGTMTQYSVDLSAYTGQQVYIAFRHHNVTDMFRLNLDDVQITYTTTDPTIVTSSQNINFGSTLIGSESTQQVTVSAYNLTAGITATTTAPFSVSADGTTYGTTATIAQNGGTLYVKYAPTAAGANSDIVVLSSTGATNDTIAVTGSGLDCSNNTFPYFCDFSDAGQNQCWTVVDANNDGTTFTLSTASAYAAYHWHSTNAANDWLISPAFTFTGTQSLTFDCRTGSSWAEIYEVFAIGNDTVRLCQPDTVQSSSFLTKTLDISGLNGSYSIAIHCISEADQYYLYITNFNILDATNAIVTVDETAFNYGIIPVGSTLAGTFNVGTTNLNEAITIATAAPFGVSLDGTTYNTTVTIPADSTFITSTQVYVRFAPTAAGTFNDNVLITTSVSSDTINLTGSAVECNAITSFPFVETFDTSSTTRVCWEIVDNNNDGKTFIFATLAGEWIAACPYHTTNASDDYLISPEITLTNGLYGHLDYAAYSASYPEKMSVYVIPENGTIANAVNIVPTFTFNNVYSAGFETLNFDLSAYANQTIRVAIKAESDANKYYVLVDNFTIDSLPAPSMTVNPTSMSFNGIMNTPTIAQTATVSATSLSNDISVAVTGPFEVSTDGTTFAATATIAQASIINATLYVRMNATTAGAQNGTITLTSDTLNATITLSGSATDCSGAHSLPFTEDFNGDIIPPTCWSYNDVESFGRASVDDAGDYAIYIANQDMLVTPELTSAEPMHVKFGYRNYLGNYGTSTFRVGFSSTDNNASSFTWFPAISINAYPADDVVFFDFNSDLPATTKYIAIEVLGLGTYGSYADAIYIDNFLVDNNLSINEYNDNVSVYPNPANNSVNVNAASNINMIEVFNMMGQRVAAYDANDTNIQINTTALNNGMYMMRITTENGVSNQKLMIAR